MTADEIAAMNAKVLANFAAELHDACDLQFIHLAHMAEAKCCTNLGQQLRDLVEDERTRRVFASALAGPGGEGGSR